MKNISKNLILLFILAALGCGNVKQNSTLSGDGIASKVDELVSVGEYISLTDRDVYPPISSKLLYLQPEGTQVEKGDIVGRLSPQARKEDLKQKLVSLKGKKVALDSQIKIAKLLVKLEKNSLKKAKIKVEKTQIELDRAQRLREFQKILELKTQLKVSRLQLELLTKKLNSVRQLVKKGFASKVEELKAETDLRLAQEENSLNEKLIPYLLKTPADKKKIFSAKNSLKLAKKDFNVAKKQHDKKISEGIINGKIKDREYLEVASQVAELEAEIEKLQIKSPISGILIYGMTYDGSGWVKTSQGGATFSGVSVFRIVNKGKGGVKFDLSQRDRKNISSGTIVYFRPDSYQEKLISGKVNFISPMAISVNQQNQDGIKKVEVKAKLDEIFPDLKFGFSGTISLNSRKSMSAPDLARPKLKVTKKKFSRKISLSGEIKPGKLEQVAAPFSGRINFVIAEGKKVSQGEHIATFDTSEMKQKASDIKIKLEKQKEELILLKEKNKLDENKLKRLEQIKKEALKVALLEHETLLARRDHDQIIDLKKSIELSKEKLILANEKFKHTKELLKKGLRSEIELLETELEVQKLERSILLDTNKLQLEESGPTKSKIKLSRLGVEDARIDLDRSKIDSDYGCYNNELNYNLKKAEIELTSLELSEIEDKIKKAKITANKAGTVILPETYKDTGGRGKVKIGDNLQNRIPFMHIADKKSLQIKIEVSEMDVKFLKKGQEAKVFLKNSPEKTFRAWVKDIGVIATQDFASRQDSVVEVILALTSKKMELLKFRNSLKPATLVR